MANVIKKIVVTYIDGKEDSFEDIIESSMIAEVEQLVASIDGQGGKLAIKGSIFFTAPRL